MKFTDDQLQIVDKILSSIPDKYNVQLDGNIKRKFKRNDINELIKLDPSESVRSENILRIIKDKLEIIHLAYTGGTILNPY